MLCSIDDINLLLKFDNKFTKQHWKIKKKVEIELYVPFGILSAQQIN